MKEKFDALAKRDQNWIVDKSTARDFTVTQKHIDQLSDPESKKCSSWKVFEWNPSTLSGIQSHNGKKYIIVPT